MKKVILVTEGAEFIGSHLCWKLTKNSEFVNAVDNFYTGTFKIINGLL